MNTKKALNIIILLLIIINICMLAFILFFNSQKSEKENEVNYVNDILNYRGIEVKIPIETTGGNKEGIIFKKGIFDSDFITNGEKVTGGKFVVYEDNTILQYTNLNENKPTEFITNRFDADKKVRVFLDQIGFNNNKYIVDSVIMSSRNTYHLKYYCVLNDEMLYDLYIYAVIDEYGISTLSICYMENAKDNTISFKVLPMSNIIMSKGIFKEANSGIIERVDSGYKSDTNNNLQYVWRVTFENGVVKYYNASDGKEIK